MFGVWLAISALTRFTALLVFPPALLAVVWGYLLHHPGKPRARLARGALVCFAALVAAALASGAFYVRNQILYGDVTGAKALLEDLHRTPHDPFLREATRGANWLELLDMLWNRLAGGVVLKDVEIVGRLVAGLGAILGLVRLVRERKKLARPLTNIPLAGTLVVVMGFVFVTLPIFEFFSRGGQLSARYFFPMMWVPWFLVALGLHVTKRRIVAVGAVVSIAIIAFVVTDLYLARLMTSPVGDLGMIAAFTHLGVPHAEWLVGVFVLAFAGALGAVVLHVQALAAGVDGSNDSSSG